MTTASTPAGLAVFEVAFFVPPRLPRPISPLRLKAGRLRPIGPGWNAAAGCVPVVRRPTPVDACPSYASTRALTGAGRRPFRTGAG